MWMEQSRFLYFETISRLNQIGLNPALLRHRFCSSFPNFSFNFFSNFLFIVGHSNCKILTPLGILQHEWLKLSSSARQLVPKAVSVIAKKKVIKEKWSFTTRDENSSMLIPLPLTGI